MVDADYWYAGKSEGETQPRTVSGNWHLVHGLTKINGSAQSQTHKLFHCRVWENERKREINTGEKFVTGKYL